MKIEMIPFNRYFMLLSTYLRPRYRQVLLLVLLVSLSTLLTVINPQILKYYVDTVLDPSIVDLSTLATAALIYILIAVIAQILQVLSVYLGQALAWDSTNQLRFDLLDHTLDLDMEFHNEHKPGSMVERIDGDVLMLSTFFSTLTLYLGRNVLLILSILIALFLENWMIGLLFTIFTVIGLYFMTLSSRPASKEWKKVREATAETYGYVEERISGKEDILALGAEENTMKGFFGLARTQYRVGMKALISSSYVRIVIFAIIGVSTTLVYMAGVPLVQSSTITLGSIFLIADYIRLLSNPITNIGFQAQELQQADAAIDRVNQVFEREKNIVDHGTAKISDGPLSITFDNLSFAYTDNELVLSEIFLHIPKHTSIGIIGKTGSGKTTLSRLIFRLYDPQHGSIIINGRDIRDYPLRELRGKISIVTQNVDLFNGTLRDNITLFDPKVSDERVLRAIEDIGLSRWFNQLNDGLDTKIRSDNGFSAGEAQLIAFARVFLQDPQIVILDEASSRLDPATEVLVDQAVSQLLKNRTAIIIAHRLSTINQVNSIAILDQGQLVETGSRKELEKDEHSRFSSLLRTNLLEELI